MLKDADSRLHLYDSQTYQQLFSLDLVFGGSPVNGTIKVRVKYSDNTPTGKLNQVFFAVSNYTELTGDYFLQSGNVRKIKVQIDHKSPSSKIYVDDVRLLYWWGDPARVALPE
jgi:hypothetical protein